MSKSSKSISNAKAYHDKVLRKAFPQSDIKIDSDIVNIDKLLSLPYNPFEPSIESYVKDLYDLHSIDPTQKLQEDILAKAKVMLDQTYALNDYKNFASMAKEITSIVAQIKELKSSELSQDKLNNFDAQLNIIFGKK